MGRAASELDPVADLEQRLLRRPPASARALRAAVDAWWADHELTDVPAAVGKRIGLALLEHAPAAPASRARPARRPPSIQQAGVVVLGELLADDLRGADLPTFASLFAGGRLVDVSVVDAFAIKVLGTLLHRVRGRQEVARTLAGWKHAESVLQRRAVCVAFTALAPQGDDAIAGLTALVLSVCATVVWSPDRVDQAGVAWLLRELSRAEPTRVEAFLRRHARFMTREAVRQAVDRFPAGKQADLVVHWKRATTAKR